MSRQPKYNPVTLYRLWYTGLRTEEIAHELMLTRAQLQAAAERLGLGQRPASHDDIRKGRVEDPTPEEITAACEEIRKRWSPDEERRRRGGRGPWTAPVFRM